MGDYNDSGFGVPSDGSENKPKWKWLKIRQPDFKKGETETRIVVRLIPPIKSLKESGKWNLYYAKHYGYFGVNKKDPSKTQVRPFLCIQKKDKTGKILQRCPECDLIERNEKERQRRVLELEERGATKDQIKTATENLNAWKQTHNCDKKFYMLVMEETGEFGVLALSYSTKTKILDPILTKYGAANAMNPTGGIWLEMTATGYMREKTDKIEVLQESLEVEGIGVVHRNKSAAMTSEQIKAALEVLPDLSGEPIKPTELTLEQISILATSGGDPDIVDKVFSMGSKVEYQEAHATRQTVSAVDTLTALTASVPAVPVLSVDPPEAIVTKSSLTADVTPIPSFQTVPATTTTTPEDIKNMSDDEFFSRFSK